MHCWRYKSLEWFFEAPLPKWVPKNIAMPAFDNNKLITKSPKLNVKLNEIGVDEAKNVEIKQKIVEKEIEKAKI